MKSLQIARGNKAALISLWALFFYFLGFSQAVQAEERPSQMIRGAAAVQRAWDALPEIQTASFLIKTNLPQGHKDGLVGEADDILEKTRKVLGVIVDLAPQGAIKYRLSVFSTMEEYRAYVSAIMTPALRNSMVEDSAGFYTSMRNEIVMACPEKGFSDCRAILAHEFSHALLGRTNIMIAGDRVNWSEIMPPWLNEGLAEYVSGRVERSNTPRWAELKAVLKSGTLMPLETLIDRQSRPLEQPHFYPSARSLVAWLVEREPSGSPVGIKRYLQAVKNKHFGEEQFGSVFGDPKELETSWNKFIESEGKEK